MWWFDRANIAALVRRLQQEGEIAQEEIPYLIEKPWKWDSEYSKYFTEDGHEREPE